MVSVLRRTGGGRITDLKGREMNIESLVELRNVINEQIARQQREHLHRLLDSLVDDIERTYMKLPIDANGEPIHIGDEVRLNKNGGKFTVRGIGENSAGNPVMWGVRELNAETTRHRIDGEVRLVRPDTVESLLKEFANKMNENIGEYVGEAIDGDEWRRLDEETIAEYAERIKKVVE